MFVANGLTSSHIDPKPVLFSPKIQELPSSVLSKLPGTEMSPQADAIVEATADRNTLVMSQLQEAVKTDQPKLLESLLQILSKDEARVLVNNTIDERGNALLFLCNSVACMNLLLDAGANPSNENLKRENFFHILAWIANADMLRAFMERHSKELCKTLANSCDDEGDTPLLICGYSPTQNCEIMNLLLDAGSNPLYANPEKETIVLVTTRLGRSELLKNFLERLSNDSVYGGEKACRELVNFQSIDGRVPLFDSLLLGSENLKCMHLLLDAGANPQASDSDGKNFLHLAAREGRWEMIKAFLERLSKDDAYGEGFCRDLMNDTDEDGITPIIECGYFGDRQTAAVLLEAGADLLAISDEGDSAYLAALIHGHDQLVKFFLKKEPKLEGTLATHLLGHVFGVRLNPKHLGALLRIEGSNRFFMNKLILADLQKPIVKKKSFSHYSEEQYKELVAAFAKATTSKLSGRKIRKQVAAIRNGQLVILPAGWAGHAIALVFRDGYLVICNRGPGAEDENGQRRTFFTRKIDLSFVTEDLLLQIIQQSNSCESDAINFFYEELPALLRGEEDAFGDKILAICPKPSKVGVCGYAAGKAALRASLALLSKDPETAKKTAKGWAIRHREWVLDFFKTSPSIFDKQFIEETFDTQLERLKVRKKLQLYRYLNQLMFSIENIESLENALKELEEFCGKKHRKNLEDCLMFLCRRKWKITSSKFGRKKFLDPEFPVSLKREAISAYLKKI